MRDFCDSVRRTFSAGSIAYFAAVLIAVAGFATSGLAQTNEGPVENAVPQVRAKDFAFYGSAQADWVTLDRPAAAGEPIVWKILKNPSSPAPGAAQIRIFNWGLFGDQITPGSWTGDATYDPGIWRAGNYWIYPSETAGSNFQVIPWGANTAGENLGREGDYDGDGIMDPTILRVVGGQAVWHIRLSATGGYRVVNFGATATGQSLFAFRGADFTGDGRDELVIARSSTTTGAVTWYIGDAATGAQLMQARWGNFNTHFIINPADYTGDGIADLVTWAAGEAPSGQLWWIRNTATGGILPPTRFGIGDPNFINMDLPIRGDYDGDGIHDLAVWRPSNATFYVLRSTDGAFVVQQWGAPTDTPLATFFTF